MLDERQLKAIELLALGELTCDEIAEKVKISPRQLARWKVKDEFRAKWQERTKEIQSSLKQEGQSRMVAKGQIAIDNILHLANTANSEKVKLDANIFVYESIFGKATSRVEDITDKQDDNSVNKEELTQEFTKFKVINAEEKAN